MRLLWPAMRDRDRGSGDRGATEGKVAQPKQEERRVVSDCGTCEQKLNQNTITNEENAIEFTGNSPTAKPIGKIALNEATSRKEKKKQRRQKEERIREGRKGRGKEKREP